ncbi:LamG domain-containing protein [Pseudomonas sp. 2FG]|uniref:LamG domain-containing protein n=1 Tax=Pseudomonas sp. 2FG TaxID=2502191 RepID=UPI0010F9D91E|nr:LamG domain-containing protein [Pseudomonas sp. 2FG]
MNNPSMSPARAALRRLGLFGLALAALLWSLGAQASPAVRAVRAPTFVVTALTTVVVRQPTGTLVGDLLIATVYVRGNATINTVPAGWNLIVNTANGTSLRQAVYWRVATTAGTGSHTWRLSASGLTRGGGMLAINAGSFDAGTPVAAVTTSNTGQSRAMTTPALVTSVNDSLVLAGFVSDRGNRALVAVSPVSTVFNARNNAAAGLATLLTLATQSTAGSFSPISATAFNASDRWVAQAWSVRPSNRPLALRLSWNLDEAAWTGAPGQVLDGSGNNLNGTAFASANTAGTTPALTTNGAGQGTCRYGSFTSASSQYAQVADNNLLDLDSYTISAWVYPRSLPSGAALMTILSKDENFELHLKSSGVVNWWWRDNSAVRQFDSTNNAAGRAPINTWTHVAIRLQPGSQRLYINGVLNNSASNALAPQINADPLRIASNSPAVGTHFNGSLDEVRVYSGALTDAQILALASERHACAGAAPHHLELLHDGTALTCQPETITLRACADASCATLFTGSVTADLTPSGWSQGVIVSDSQTLTGGTASLQLRQNNSGPVALGIVSASPAPSNPAQCYIGATASCSLDFKDTGFIFDVPSLLANKASGTIDLIAARKDDSTQRCVPAFAPGMRTVQFWSGYANPASGTQSVSVNNTPIGGSPGTSLSLNFDANARASIEVRYADAGQMMLNASYTGSAGNGDAGLVLTGSDQFVARPAGLCVYSDSANSDCASGAASCSAFVPAGDDFRLRVKAAAWESDTDTDFCSGNGTTSNYRQTGIALGSTLIAPAGGTAATLGVASVDIAAADLGEKVLSNQTVSEVGVFTISATPATNGYFGDTVSGGTSVNIGRFYPASFLLADPSLTPACSTGSTYAGLAAQAGPPAQPAKVGQTFSFTGSLSARNRSGAVTRNYTGSFAKLTGAGIGYADPGSAGTLNTSSTSLTEPGVGGAGTLDYSANAANFLFSTPRAPYNLAIRSTATDSDTVTGSVTDAQTSDFRLGQARIGNAHGSELQDLRLPFSTAFFNGSGYAPNPLDSCTVFDPAALAGHQGNLAVGETLLSYLNSAGAAGAPYVVSGGSSLLGGYLLSAPGAGNDGSVRLTYSTPSWLQFDWDGDGVLEDASGLATFGIYRGAARLIYRRELYRGP